MLKMSSSDDEVCELSVWSCDVRMKMLWCCDLIVACSAAR